MIEDSIDDIELLLMQLRQGNYEPLHRQVETREEVSKALEEEWDIVLSDYSMPLFDGLSALKLVREKDPDLPFILVSGIIGEELAVKIMKSGAQDYIMKDNLQRLVPAIERELKEAELKRQRREAIEARMISETRFRNVFECSVDAIGVACRGMHQLVNPAYVKLFGYNSEEEVIGKKITDLIAVDERQRISDYVRQRMLGGQVPDRYETKGLRKDLSEFDMDVRVSLYEMNGEINTLVILRDVTESNRARQELIEAKNRAEELSNHKTNFLANMNHEFRTPLNGILGYSELLIENLLDPDLKLMAHGIRESGMRLNKTLELILALSEIEAETLAVFSKKMNAIELVRSGVAMFSEEIAKKGLELKVELEAGPVYVELDEHLFKRVVYCLLDNALKFTDQGAIRVKAGTEDVNGVPRMYLRIEDTGIGISSDDAGLIWKEFRQVSEGRARSYQGTGLGLTITKRAVELMGGQVSVFSKPGHGSVFTVNFPLADAAGGEQSGLSNASGKSDEATSYGNDYGMPLVLYVEDDPANREIMSIFLKNTCQIETAPDGETALDMVKEKRYDLVLMDINLGTGKDGLDVVKDLLNVPGYQEVKVVAVTAYSTSNDKAEFLQGGCTHYIAKPFRKQDVISLVASILTKEDHNAA